MPISVRQRTDASTQFVCDELTHQSEIHMYIGGGILGTILVIALIIWLFRRA
jgi:O-antigen ligase